MPEPTVHFQPPPSLPAPPPAPPPNPPTQPQPPLHFPPPATPPRPPSSPQKTLPRHAAIPPVQRAVSRLLPLLPHGRFLRNVLGRRQGRQPRARRRPHQP